MGLYDPFTPEQMQGAQQLAHTLHANRGDVWSSDSFKALQESSGVSNGRTLDLATPESLRAGSPIPHITPQQIEDQSIFTRLSGQLNMPRDNWSADDYGKFFYKGEQALQKQIYANSNLSSTQKDKLANGVISKMEGVFGPGFRAGTTTMQDVQSYMDSVERVIGNYGEQVPSGFSDFSKQADKAKEQTAKVKDNIAKSQEARKARNAAIGSKMSFDSQLKNLGMTRDNFNAGTFLNNTYRDMIQQVRGTRGLTSKDKSAIIDSIRNRVDQLKSGPIEDIEKFVNGFGRGGAYGLKDEFIYKPRQEAENAKRQAAKKAAEKEKKLNQKASDLAKTIEDQNGPWAGFKGSTDDAAKQAYKSTAVGKVARMREEKAAQKAANRQAERAAQADYAKRTAKGVDKYDKEFGETMRNLKNEFNNGFAESQGLKAGQLHEWVRKNYANGFGKDWTQEQKDAFDGYLKRQEIAEKNTQEVFDTYKKRYDNLVSGIRKIKGPKGEGKLTFSSLRDNGILTDKDIKTLSKKMHKLKEEGKIEDFNDAEAWDKNARDLIYQRKGGLKQKMKDSRALLERTQNYEEGAIADGQSKNLVRRSLGNVAEKRKQATKAKKGIKDAGKKGFGLKGKAGAVMGLLALGGVLGNMMGNGGRQSNAQMYNPNPQPQYYS